MYLIDGDGGGGGLPLPYNIVLNKIELVSKVPYLDELVLCTL